MTQPPPPPSSPPGRPPPGPPPPRPVGTAPLAIASIVCSAAGLLVVPLLGGVLGAVLGVAALVQLRHSPGLAGRGLAIAGTVLGLVAGVVPLAVLAYIERARWSPAPFAVTVAYGGALAALLWRETAGRQRLAAGAGFFGGVGFVVLAGVVAWFGAILFIDGIKALVRLVFHQVGCTVRQAVNVRGKGPRNCPAPAGGR